MPWGSPFITEHRELSGGRVVRCDLLFYSKAATAALFRTQLADDDLRMIPLIFAVDGNVVVVPHFCKADWAQVESTAELVGRLDALRGDLATV